MQNVTDLSHKCPGATELQGGKMSPLQGRNRSLRGKTGVAGATSTAQPSSVSRREPARLAAREEGGCETKVGDKLERTGTYEKPKRAGERTPRVKAIVT